MHFALSTIGRLLMCLNLFPSTSRERSQKHTWYTTLYHSLNDHLFGIRCVLLVWLSSWYTNSPHLLAVHHTCLTNGVQFTSGRTPMLINVLYEQLFHIACDSHQSEKPRRNFNPRLSPSSSLSPMKTGSSCSIIMGPLYPTSFNARNNPFQLISPQPGMR